MRDEWDDAVQAAVAAAMEAGGVTRQKIVVGRVGWHQPERGAVIYSLSTRGMPRIRIARAMNAKGVKNIDSILNRFRDRMDDPYIAALLDHVDGAVADAAPKGEDGEEGKRRRPRIKWTDEEKQVVQDCIRAGMNVFQIMMRLPNRSADAIESVMYTVARSEKKARDGDEIANREWSEREDEVLRTGYATGVPLREIMARLSGRSKSAIAGRAARLGLQADSSNRERRPDADYMTMAIPPAKTCQYIHGDTYAGMDAAGNALMCGAPVVPGYSWCAEHMKLIYQGKEAEGDD